MSWPLAWRQAVRQAVREWRAGESWVWLLSLMIAVTTLTAVSFFTSRVERAMALRANEILASDIRIQSNHALPSAYMDKAVSQGLRTAQVRSFPSVVVKDDLSALVSIQAVSSDYPLRGSLKVSDNDSAPSQLTTRPPNVGEVWIDPRLLTRLNLEVGQSLQLGESQLRIAKLLLARPDQGSQFASLAPTVLMRVEDVVATGLIGPGSRVQYAQLFAGDAAKVAAFTNWLMPRLQAGERRQEVRDASEQVSSSLERAGRFLRLTSLTSVLLAGVAVAMAARRYVARHLDVTALMKAMGASQALVLKINLLQIVWVSVLAGVLGTLLGFLAQQGLAVLMRDVLQGQLPPPGWTPWALGLLTPLIMCAGVTLPPLMQLQRVPSVRVLREHAAPPALRFQVIYGAAFAALVVLLWLLLRDAQLIAYVVGGAALVLALLAGAAGALVYSLRGLRSSVGVSWRYGLANVVRRGGSSMVQVMAFGLGLMVLLLLLVVRNDLQRDWQASLPADAPNQFLINIAPEQRVAVQDFFIERGVPKPDMVPMLRARLSFINDTPVDQWQVESDKGRDFRDREANLSWADKPPEGNQIIAGSWWRSDDHTPQISIEQRYAKEVQLKLGDRLTYDVNGTPVTATITSIRDVRWDSFKPNFFVLFSPGVLEDAVGTYITSVHVPVSERRIMGEFYRAFPDVTAIDVEVILAQVRAVVDNVSLAIQYVFGFALLAGVMVLMAAVQATQEERRHESALLRALGAPRAMVWRGVAAEFMVLGLVSGVLASLAASLIGYGLATRVFNLSYTFDPTVWLVGVVSGVVLVAGTGLWATRRVVNASPMLTLREH